MANPTKQWELDHRDDECPPAADVWHCARGFYKFESAAETVEWLRSRIGAKHDPWIQNEIAKLTRENE